MNGKKAKSLRKLVSLSTATENSYVRKSIQKEKIRVETDSNGLPVGNIPYTVTTVTIQLKEGSRRHFYKFLKRVYKSLNSSKKAEVLSAMEAAKVGESIYAKA